MIHSFKTTKDIFNAGYAIPSFNIMSDSKNWELPNGSIVTTGNIQTEMNNTPNIPIVKVEYVLKNSIKIKEKK